MKNNEQFETLKQSYIEHSIDGMDIDTMIGIITEMIGDRLNELPINDVLNEIKQFAPHLID